MQSKTRVCVTIFVAALTALWPWTATGQEGRQKKVFMITVMEGVDSLESWSNYYIGQTAANWHSRVPNYARVRYRDLWPGIDVVFYGTGRQLEFAMQTNVSGN